MNPALTAVAAVAALAWLWFLWRGRSPGALKRIGLRLTLLGLMFGLVMGGRARGIFARSSIGFQLVMLVAVLIVTVGYLYLIRFCPVCGRMVRDLKPAQCPRCGSSLPRHGMTDKLRTPDDGRRQPLLRRPRAPEDGPQA